MGDSLGPHLQQLKIYGKKILGASIKAEIVGTNDISHINFCFSTDLDNFNQIQQPEFQKSMMQCIADSGPPGLIKFMIAPDNSSPDLNADFLDDEFRGLFFASDDDDDDEPVADEFRSAWSLY